jgi:predicted DNA-binding transcriptional regulator AlpA
MCAAVEDRVLTLQELADRYQVSVWTVYSWNKTRTGPAYFRPGGLVCRYRLADVLAWERTRMVERGRVA